MSDDEADAWVRKQLANAPRLTDNQKMRLKDLFHPVDTRRQS